MNNSTMKDAFPSLAAAMMLGAMDTPLNNNARGYRSASTGTNRSKRLRTVYTAAPNKDIPKGHEIFYFTESGECFGRADIANIPKEERPDFIHNIIAVNRKKAIKQFKANMAEAEASDDILPGSECAPITESVSDLLDSNPEMFD